MESSGMREGERGNGMDDTVSSGRPSPLSGWKAHLMRLIIIVIAIAMMIPAHPGY